LRIKDDAERLAALRKYLVDYPRSTFNPIAKVQIFKALVATGASEKEYLPIAEEGLNQFPNLPQKARLLYEVAYVLADQGKGLDQAAKYIDQAIKFFPVNTDPEQLATLQDLQGWIEFKRGNLAEAIKMLEVAKKAAGNASTFEHLAQAYEKAGQFDKAIDAYLSAVALSGDAVLQQRRYEALKTAFIKKNGSDAGLERSLDDRKFELLKERALVKARYEAAAPAWELKNLKGEAARSADFRGHVLVLDWWGSWCPPCREELPHFQKLYETYKDKGVIFIGINFEQPGPSEDAKKDIVRKFLAEKSFTFPVLLDFEMEVGQKFDIEGFPTVFIIDGNGQIRYRNVGFTADVADMMEIQIKSELTRAVSGADKQ
jgi:thiol-disulfide isomerase/thioredoxin